MPTTDPMVEEWADLLTRLARPSWGDHDNDRGPSPTPTEEDCDGDPDATS